jgi:hypothetical protein
VHARAVRQNDELRRRRGVFGFERGARNVGGAEHIGSNTEQDGDDGNNDQKTAHAAPPGFIPGDGIRESLRQSRQFSSDA